MATAQPMLEAAQRKRADKLAEMDLIVAKAEARGQGSLLASERRAFDAARRVVEDLEEQIADHQYQVDRSNTAAAASRPSPGFSRGADTVYGPESGQSYFRDLAMLTMPGDPRAYQAQARLAAHAQMIDRAQADLPAEFRADSTRAAADLELRVTPNTTDGMGGYAVPPLWLVNQWIAALRPGRPVADRCHQYPLPPGTDSINIPGFNTPTLAGTQSTDLAGVVSQDFTDRAATGAVHTIAGTSDVAIQLLDLSPANLDEILFTDLIASYNQQLDKQVINGTGTANQHLGLLNVTGTNAVTFTSASPTVPLLYTPLAQAAAQVAKLRYKSADTIAMHPSHWWWIASALDSQNRPLVEPKGGDGINTVAVYDPMAAEGVAGSIAGIPVIVDANIPTNLGAGTNQAPIIVARMDDVYLYEGAMRIRALPGVLSGILAVRLQVYNYSALIANRYPTAVSIVNGTGNVVPTGF